MKFAVHTEHPSALRQALQSQCDVIRYGADLCEFKLPSNSHVEDFAKQLERTDKEFCYVCPRLPEHLFPVVERHLHIVDAATTRPVRVVANDWGVLNQIIDGKYQHLIPYMGRQLVSIPNRGQPSIRELMGGENLFKRLAVETLGGIVFNKTNLHFGPTVDFLRMCHVLGADIDWIPDTFSEMRSVVKSGIQFSVHLGLAIVAVVRRCHTARYYGEPIPESCSRPCFSHAFNLKHEVLGEFHMDGNTIFRMSTPNTSDVKRLLANEPYEIVLTMSPMTQIQTTRGINDEIDKIKTMM